ncbi:DNA-formamidopyrimidine glycosylase family protein [Microbacterium sp. MPKO10]|uniref:DNA-formamidopyrimidine glycosylase family protein n=1 Tax=Microbacterium sp. MPKO10 TaxID=2989818 RepID=UPI002235832C|nr:DNA-formamidopyrimidine glycosylase family protein [Microbacterium sp. MPKO10]MCW4458765.1 Fpg/Nei family DNA glycosylase [Microbacterium sp. MPKO10]
MPEGDTVYRTAHNLNRVLAGHTIEGWSLRVPAYATSDLTGRTIDEVVSRGKHILLRASDMTLHSHLKMEGDWHIYARGARWKKPAHAARAVIETQDHTVVGFDLGIVELMFRADEHRAVGHLGPDLLGPDWSPREATERLDADSQRSVASALLDQRNLAGLGNEYVTEICFLRGIRPDTTIADADASALVSLAHRLITANRDRVARTTTGDTRPGRQSWVYGRAGKPCRRCGTLIERGTHEAGVGHERITFICPRCQPEVTATGGQLGECPSIQ